MTDYAMKRGDTFKTTLYVKDVNGSPQNVTGWIFWFTVKRFATDPDQNAIFQARSDDLSGAVTIDVAVTGQVTVRMPAFSTRLFPDTPTRVVWDVQSKNVVGEIATVDEGKIKITPDVTRATS